MLLGKTATHRVMKLSRAYVRKLYNQHAATVVASDLLGRVLRDWGVHNVRVLSLGVNTEIFRPTDPEPKQYGARLALIQVKSCFFT